MTSFVASKFNAETDEDRPQLGSDFNHQDTPDIVYVTEKVDWIDLSDIIAGKNKPEQGEYDSMLLRGHKSRPSVYWIQWGNLNE